MRVACDSIPTTCGQLHQLPVGNCPVDCTLRTCRRCDRRQHDFRQTSLGLTCGLTATECGAGGARTRDQWIMSYPLTYPTSSQTITKNPEKLHTTWEYARQSAQLNPREHSSSFGDCYPIAIRTYPPLDDVAQDRGPFPSALDVSTDDLDGHPGTVEVVGEFVTPHALRRALLRRACSILQSLQTLLLRPSR